MKSNSSIFKQKSFWMKILLLIGGMACNLSGTHQPVPSFEVQGHVFRYVDFSGFFWSILCIIYAFDRQMNPKRAKVYRSYFLILGAVILALAVGTIYKNSQRLTQEKNSSDYLPGSTPLMKAAMAGDTSRVKVLLGEGADIYARDKLDLSAIDYASGAIQQLPPKSSGSMDVIRIFAERGADFNRSGLGGHTPLMYAVRSNNLALIDLLISKGADVNRVSNDGHTALFYAELDQRQDVVDLLKKAGAQSKGPGESGQTQSK